MYGDKNWKFSLLLKATHLLLLLFETLEKNIKIYREQMECKNNIKL